MLCCPSSAKEDSGSTGSNIGVHYSESLTYLVHEPDASLPDIKDIVSIGWSNHPVNDRSQKAVVTTFSIKDQTLQQGCLLEARPFDAILCAKDWCPKQSEIRDDSLSRDAMFGRTRPDPDEYTIGISHGNVSHVYSHITMADPESSCHLVEARLSPDSLRSAIG